MDSPRHRVATATGDPRLDPTKPQPADPADPADPAAPRQLTPTNVGRAEPASLREFPIEEVRKWAGEFRRRMNDQCCRLYLLAECPHPTHERGDSSLPLSGPRTPLKTTSTPLPSTSTHGDVPGPVTESAPSRACSASQDSTSRCTSSTGWPASADKPDSQPDTAVGVEVRPTRRRHRSNSRWIPNADQAQSAKTPERIKRRTTAQTVLLSGCLPGRRSALGNR